MIVSGAQSQDAAPTLTETQAHTHKTHGGGGRQTGGKQGKHNNARLKTLEK